MRTEHCEYLVYWKYEWNQQNMKAGWPLNHTAGEQLYKVRKGDRLWVVTLKDGEMYLLGPIEALTVTNQHTAERRLKTRNLWKAHYHVIAEPGSVYETGFCPVSLSVVMKLEFMSRLSPCLSIENGKVDGRQLQAMRKLTADSADLLEKVWSDYDRTRIP